ncbi:MULTISPECIES: MBL fold metallo-hydrolase [Acinetobacter]|uniref:Metallo-hydrolase n=1 Tax=Acinetobacter baumannii TaxID=470 RepID=A0AAJ0VPD9_ACIBA|nr:MULTISPECIES: MBL fold metallo-hydrolase [Acinetobacter]EHU1483395.1 MBL fold metallo-hydrolase [Acinetobacter baumannii]EHU1663102.1 MBL fold metallo-hydrolase [Acinetobacter baumannii]EHU1784456.1 MBL fold metallo-hydrolase [Acinetobacter baumannii]EHU1857345.1 MBL fold metallo-hydrolase [Acinetobacter baumannii]EHU1955964.1 MBL fold metallo-hydrolase [Acinetobacter baumannii]
MSNSPVVKDFFHEDTHTFSYVVSDPSTKACAIIDSVLDYDAASASTSTIHADKIIAYVKEQGLTVEWILETHVHADHLTAAQYLKATLGGKIAMSHKIAMVQKTFAAIYHLDIKQWNTQQMFDHLFEDYEKFQIGSIEAYNIPTPGHTPACLSYVIGDAVFVGDTLFMPDYGTARCDFPKGSASTLFDSIQSLYQLPEKTRVFLCHDYLPEKRDTYMCKTDIQTQKKHNIHVHEGTTKAEFVEMRNKRDALLSMPELILPSIQINMKAGQFPEPEDNGVSYLKLPLNYFK